MKNNYKYCGQYRIAALKTLSLKSLQGLFTDAVFPAVLLLALSGQAQASTDYEEQPTASAINAAVDVSPPAKGYASDNWLINGAGNWTEERARREQELSAYLTDTDKTRAAHYGFREGQTPALAWKWFDQYPIGYGGVPYVLLQTILSLDPATETDPYLLALANIWKKKSVIADEQDSELYTLDHLGFGPNPADYKNGVAIAPADRQQKLPNGFVYDPDVEPESVYFVNFRLRWMRDGLLGGLMKRVDPNYQPKIAELLVLARGKARNKLFGGEIDYEKEVDRLQEPPATDAVFFACTGCHQGRVIVGGEMDAQGNIVKPGKMKFLPGMPNTEIEAQYFSQLLMESGLALIESGFTVDAAELPKDSSAVVPSKGAILALYTRLLSRAIDDETVKTIYGSSPEQIERARIQTYRVAKDFPTYVGDLIGVAIKTQYIYFQVAKRYAYNPDNPLKQSPGQVVPDVMNNRIGQMDAFGIASGLVSLHTLRKDNSYIKFMYADNPQNPIFTGFDTIEGFSGPATVDTAGERIRNTLANWAPPVPAPVDVKSLNWSGDRELANWDGNQGASARTLASGTSATGDPLKVNVKIHEPLNPLINNMPPPPYPFDIDKDKARRGSELFHGTGLSEHETCAGCHQPRKDWIFKVSKLGVDANRSLVNTDVSRYGLATLVMEACKIFIRKNPDNDWCLPRDDEGNIITNWEQANDDYFKDTPGRVRAGKNGYKVDMLHGIWARAPYLHNGSVPTLMNMLCPETRPTEFKRGVLFYNQQMVGFEWLVEPQQRYSPYETQQVKTYDTRQFGRANTGHHYGSSLCPDTRGLDPAKDRDEIVKRLSASKVSDLLEYLKTL